MKRFFNVRQFLSLFAYPVVLCLLAINAHAVDVEMYDIAKGSAYEQTGSGDPVLAGSTPYGFGAYVEPTTAGAVSSAMLTLPGGSSVSLVLDPDGYFWIDTEFASVDAMNAAYPAGTYTFTVNTANDGVKILPLTLAAAALPNAPKITNWTAAQAIDSTAAFTLHWNPFLGGSVLDIIDVEIWELSGDMVFATMLFDLDGTSTSVEIPSGTFTPGMTYEAWVNFVRVVDLDQATYPGAIGAAVYGTGTQFTIATLGSGGLWGNAVDLGNGWKWLGWFGFFNTNFDPWTFHLQHRWLFPFGITTASVTFWDNAMGAFWWTSESVYPYGYRFADGAWLFYEVGSVNPRWFYNFQIAQWESYP